MSNILVTGGAGFIGSNLAEKLVSLGHKVRVLDNFSTGKMENIAHLLNNSDFQLITGDIRDTETCMKCVQDIDFIFHEAALGSVPRSIKDPSSSVAVNISGFVNILFAAVQAKVKRVIYASSSSVYGDNQDLPKTEENTGTPLSPYALTKSVDEQFAENFNRIYSLDCIGLRYFNVFGPRQDPAGAYAAVIPKFAALLMSHIAPTINGDGSYSRDFTFIDDVVRANILAMETDKKEALNTVFNIGGNHRTSLDELFIILREKLGRYDAEILKISPLYAPVRQGDVPHSLASVAKAGKLLNYSPLFTAEKGLERFAEYLFSQSR